MMKKPIINIKRLTETAKIPTKGSEGAAGFDLYSDTSCVIWQHDHEKISTGIAMEIPRGYVGLVYARSGLSTNQGLRPTNCVGVIDSDYRGPIHVPLFNDSEHRRTIMVGDRIAQIVITPYLECDLVEIDELTDTERGSGGFGSTGM